MSCTRVDCDDVAPVSDGLSFLREPLGTENVGVSILECEPGYEGMEHDHAEDGREEVYVLVEGRATVHVDGDSIEMTAGDALRISPEATRRIENGDVESRFVLVGAP